jgi:hypothetical protein
VPPFRFISSRDAPAGRERHRRGPRIPRTVGDDDQHGPLSKGQRGVERLWAGAAMGAGAIKRKGQFERIKL